MLRRRSLSTAFGRKSQRYIDVGKCQTIHLTAIFCLFAQVVEIGIHSVAKQFGIHAEQVKRCWNKLTEEQQQSIRDAHEKVAENISRKVKKSILDIVPQEAREGLTDDDVVEALNRSTIKAEALVSDSFVENVKQSRMMLGEELVRRCGDPLKLQLMSHKDFSTLLRLVSTIAEPQPSKDDDGDTKQGGTLERLRMNIASEIYNKQNIN